MVQNVFRCVEPFRHGHECDRQTDRQTDRTTGVNSAE